MTWLYIDAPRSYSGYIRELLFGIYEYFSISLLTRTLFAPYRHDAVDISKLPFSYWGRAIAENVVSRSVGFILRSFVISTGTVVLVSVGIGSILFLLGWFLLPFLLVSSIVYGLTLLAGGV